MNFPQSRPVLAIVVSLAANGSSSYRDARNIARVTVAKWSTVVVVQLTDCPKEFKKPCVEVTSALSFTRAITALVSKYSLTHDVMFTISAHGYRRAGHEFIYVHGQTVLDTSIRTALYTQMSANCLSLCLIDTCHSGTMLDLSYVSTDGKTFKHVPGALVVRPRSFCISACSDSEQAGEDISLVGGFGGKLICQFLDHVDAAKGPFCIGAFFRHVRKVFTSQTRQCSHPVFSKTSIAANQCV